MALYQISINTLKTIFPPNFVLLTESEQFQHISAPLRGIYIHLVPLHSPSPPPDKVNSFEPFINNFLFQRHRSLFNNQWVLKFFCLYRTFLESKVLKYDASETNKLYLFSYSYTLNNYINITNTLFCSYSV